MLPIAAVLLAAALFLDLTRLSYGHIGPDVFMAAGLALLMLAILPLSWPRRRRVAGHSRVQAPTCENAEGESGNRRSGTGDEQ